MADVERVPLAQADGRVLAQDVRAPRPIPAHRNAAVDGYAFRFEERGDHALPVAERIAAGAAGGEHGPGTASRIFTGAPMPRGADTVAMQEDCALSADGVRLPALKRGANVRAAGEDVAEGAVVLSAGVRLGPAELAAIASAGSADIPVRRRLRVALMANGAELLRPGEPFREAAVYDSNTPMLAALLRRFGCDVMGGGIVPDDAATVRASLADAADRADAVVASAGASKGEEDHMLAALDALGKRHLWQLAVKPGRPMMMGQIGDAPVVGLPGNPVAAMVCTLLYLRPLLDRLAGAQWTEPVRYTLPAAFSLRSKPDRREFLRGWTERRGDETVVAKFPRDGSGLISGLVAATGLIEIPEHRERVEEGDPVPFIPFSELGSA